MARLAKSAMVYTKRKMMAIPKPVMATPKFPMKEAMEKMMVGTRIDSSSSISILK